MLKNLLDIYQYTSLISEEGKRSSYPWFQDGVKQVVLWISQDRTTTSEDLREKAENYARNYLAIHPELSSINKDDLVREIADDVEQTLKNKNFDLRPPASVLAQDERNKIPEDPENRFIKLRP